MGAAATAVGGVALTYRACVRLPVVGPLLNRGVTGLAERGDQVITAGLDPIKELTTTIAVQITERVLDELNLTALVQDRVDLIGLANEVIDGVDLPAIIRESTTSVTAEVMADVRTQGERADDLVSGFVDRLLGREQQ